MDGKRTGNKTRSYLGSRAISYRKHNKGELNTDPDTKNSERLLQLFKDYYMPKRNTYHSLSDFLGKTRGKRNPGKALEKDNLPGKNCEFKDIKQEDLLISKFITSNTNKKLPEKLISEKTLNLKTTMDLVTQDSYEKRHKQPTIPTALVKRKKKNRNQYKKYTKTTNQTKHIHRKTNTEEKVLRILRATKLDTIT